MKWLLALLLCLPAFGQDFASVAVVGNLFHPREIHGVMAIFDSNEIRGLTNSQGVSTWNDSRFNFKATNSTSSKQPILIRANGLQYVRFDGVDDWLDCDGIQSVATPLSMYSVANVTWVSGAYSPYIFDSSTGAGRIAFIYNGNLNNTNAFGMYNNGGTLYTSTLGDFYNKDFIALGIFNGGSSSFFTNGILRNFGNSGSGGYSTPLVIGSRYNHTYTMLGNVMEIAMFTNSISFSDRIKYDEYLSCKWRVQTSRNIFP